MVYKLSKYIQFKIIENVNMGICCFAEYLLDQMFLHLFASIEMCLALLHWCINPHLWITLWTCWGCCRWMAKISMDTDRWRSFQWNIYWHSMGNYRSRFLGSSRVYRWDGLRSSGASLMTIPHRYSRQRIRHSRKLQARNIYNRYPISTRLLLVDPAAQPWPVLHHCTSSWLLPTF